MSDNGLGRRAFLGMAGAGAGVALAMPQSAAAGLGPRVDLGRVVDVERRLLAGRVAPDVVPVAGWQADKLFNQAAATAMWSSVVQRASERQRRAPELANLIDDRIDGMLSTLFALGLELDSLDAAGVRETEAAFLSQESRARESALRFTARALENEVPLGVVRRVDRQVDRVLWQVRHRGLDSVRDDVLSRLDKAARRDRLDWRELGLKSAEQDFVSLTSAELRMQRASRLPQDKRIEYDGLRQRARRQTTTGAVMLGIGVLWMAGPQIIFGGICFGPPLIIAGIIKLVLAGGKRRAARDILDFHVPEGAP